MTKKNTKNRQNQDQPSEVKRINLKSPQYKNKKSVSSIRVFTSGVCLSLYLSQLAPHGWSLDVKRPWV